MTDANYPEIFSGMAQDITDALMEHGIDAEHAKRVAWEATEKFRRRHGGELVYVPKGMAYDLSARDRDIWEKWNGRNAQALCREYDVSVQHIYRIVAAMRSQEVEKRQGKLFPA